MCQGLSKSEFAGGKQGAGESEQTRNSIRTFTRNNLQKKWFLKQRTDNFYKKQ